MSVRQLLQSKPEASAFVMLIAMMIIFSFASPAFLTYNNFRCPDLVR